MLLIWIMALMGIALSFFVKYSNRTAKQKEWSLKFWADDNYIELIISMLSMIMLIIIASKSEFNNEYLSETYPWIKSIPMDLIVAGLVGYMNNALWYWIVKKAKGK